MITIYPADVVLFEGILVFYFPEVRKLFHMKLFVDTDSDTRLARRGNKIPFRLAGINVGCFSSARHKRKRKRSGPSAEPVHEFRETGF